MIWPDDFLNKIICGDCLEVMKEMPDECVDMCLTSPPYWGLRDYGIEQIFGGDKDCEHKWGKRIIRRTFGNVGKHPNVGNQKRNVMKGHENKGQFCSCGAWKGQLGLEPTPELYIEHLTVIFNEVKRVLKKEGVLFLNIGDTYAGSGGAHKPEHANPGLSKSSERDGVPRGPSYGISDKVPEDCPLRDSPLNHPCDGCQAVSVLRKFHKVHSPSSESNDDLHDPIQEHKESENDHVANLDSLNQKQPRQSSVAIQGQKPSLSHVDEQPRDVQASTIDESSQPLQDECLRKDNSFSDQLKLGSLIADVQKSARKKDDTDDIKDSPSFLVSRILGKVRNACPYLYYTIPSPKLPPKSLCMIPERLAWSLIQNGWILRNKIPWIKPNCMPSSVKDRFSNKWEYVFYFVKSQRNYFDLDRVREPYTESTIQRVSQNQGNPKWNGDHKRGSPQGEHTLNPKQFTHFKGKNPGDVWIINTQPCPVKGIHFATFPEELCRKAIIPGCPEGGIVLDPFCGVGTACYVARKLGRRFIGIDIKPEYCEKARNKRLAQGVL